jgi:hypothetical protein
VTRRLPWTARTAGTAAQDAGLRRAADTRHRRSGDSETDIEIDIETDTDRSRRMRRALAAVLTVAGLSLVLVAVMGAVLVGPRGEWRAQGRVDAGSAAVVVRPALAAVLGPRVGLQVRASDAATPLFLGRTGPDDAQALVQGLPTADVVGLDGSRRLDVRRVEGTGRTSTAATSTASTSTASTASPVSTDIADATPAASTDDVTLPVPSQVDLWHQSAEGTGTARLEWTPSPGAESFVVTRADGGSLPALDLTMTWRDARWRWLPLQALGAGALLLAAAWLLRRRPRASAGEGSPR